jgi:magnesium-transporting ATPase (P-type)
MISKRSNNCINGYAGNEKKSLTLYNKSYHLRTLVRQLLQKPLGTKKIKMDTVGIIVCLLVGIIVNIVITIMESRSTKYIDLSNLKAVELRINRLYQILGIIIILIGIFTSVSYFFKVEGSYFESISLLIFISGLGLLLLVSYQNHKLKFNEDYIMIYDYLGVVDTLKWEDVNEIEFDSKIGFLKISGDNKVLKIHRHMRNINVFFKEVKKKTKLDTYELEKYFSKK